MFNLSAGDLATPVVTYPAFPGETEAGYLRAQLTRIAVGARPPQHGLSSHNDGPNHLGLWYNALPEHQMALITWGFVRPAGAAIAPAGLFEEAEPEEGAEEVENPPDKDPVVKLAEAEEGKEWELADPAAWVHTGELLSMSCIASAGVDGPVVSWCLVRRGSVMSHDEP